MAFSNNITFIEAQGGLQTPLPGTDYISGMVFKNSTSIPSGFTYSTAIPIFSVAQAQSLGIVAGFADETAAKSLITVSATGSAGATINVTVVEPTINSTYNSVNLGTYTVLSTDTTDQILATSLSNFINIQGTGYSANTPVGGSFSLTARTGLGTTINGTSPTITETSGPTVTAAAFSAGVNSKRMFEWYQISQFFAMNPNGVLWVDYETSFGNFNCLNVVQTQASNNINQFGIFNVGATTSAEIQADVNSLNTIAQTLFQPGFAPVVILYAPNILNFGVLSGLPNARGLNAQYVSILIEQDGGALGAFLSFMYGTSCPALGNVLGLISSANVSADIGNPGNFNQVNGSELATVAFTNGQLFSYLFSNFYNLLSQLDNYGYIFGRNIPNLTGTFVNDDHSCILISSDYNFIDKNRVVNKAARVVYAGLAPLINSQLLANADGTISAQAMAILQNAVKPGLDAMVKNGNISAYPKTPGSNVNGLYINPTQNIVSTSTVAVTLNIVPIGIARSIVVTLGFTI